MTDSNTSYPCHTCDLANNLSKCKPDHIGDVGFAKNLRPDHIGDVRKVGSNKTLPGIFAFIQDFWLDQVHIRELCSFSQGLLSE